MNNSSNTNPSGSQSIQLSVIVPAYNEENNIATVINSLVQYIPQNSEIIVVDDGSKDKTAEIVQALCQKYSNLTLFEQPKNMGKTAALIAGFAASRGDIVIIQDADLEYDPTDIPSVIEPIISGRADVVYGSRFLVRRAARVLYFRHYLANKFLTYFSDMLTDINLSDVETGYKAFRGDIIRNMVIETKGFGFEIEVTAKIAKLRCRIFEVPISYYGRTYEEGKKIGVKDGIAAIGYIFKYNLFVSLAKSFRKIPDLIAE
jgi:glycosyltransferase involved in cell wall biosynthesis